MKTIACPHCKLTIGEDEVRCPFCHRLLAEGSEEEEFDEEDYE